MKGSAVIALALTLTLSLCSCVSQKPAHDTSGTKTTSASSTERSKKAENNTSKQTSKSSASTENDKTAAATANSTAPTAAEQKAEEIMKGELKNKSYNIDVPFINQNPELPTGCESVSLAMAFNALGYPTSKTELADNYMPIGGSYVTTFFGDPHKNDGTGIYPPGLVQTAQNYIDAKNLDVSPVDLTDKDFKDFYKIIENGYPIVFWITGGLYDPYTYDDEDFHEMYNGRDYPWITNIHCIVMNGYDTEDGTVTFTDPLSGTKVYDEDRVEYVYNQIGLAMTLIKND